MVASPDTQGPGSRILLSIYDSGISSAQALPRPLAQVKQFHRRHSSRQPRAVTVHLSWIWWIALMEPITHWNWTLGGLHLPEESISSAASASWFLKKIIFLEIQLTAWYIGLRYTTHWFLQLHVFGTISANVCHLQMFTILWSILHFIDHCYGL